MDRSNYEILYPVILRERLTEARRDALADLLPAAPSPSERLAIAIGYLLIRIGCRLDAAGRRRGAAIPLTLLPSPCGHSR